MGQETAIRKFDQANLLIKVEKKIELTSTNKQPSLDLYKRSSAKEFSNVNLANLIIYQLRKRGNKEINFSHFNAYLVDKPNTLLTLPNSRKSVDPQSRNTTTNTYRKKDGGKRAGLRKRQKKRLELE